MICKKEGVELPIYNRPSGGFECENISQNQWIFGS